SHHQHTTRNTPAQAQELAWIAEKLDQLANFILGFVTAGDVSKGGLDLIFREQTRLGLTEAHRSALAARAALHLPHEEHEHSDDHQNREAGHQQLGPDALLLRLLAFDQYVVIDQVADQTV